MRASLCVLLSMLVLAAAQAQELGRGEAAQLLSRGDAASRRDAALRLGEIGTTADVPTLVRALRDSDEDTRAEAERSLWRIWSRSGDPQVDRLFAAGVEQMAAGALQQSIVTFTRVIELRPGFAEGWNKRATLYFLTGDLTKSLADCAEVMKRNPYHFGALAGYAQIYVRLEQYERALTYARRALAINPNLDGVRSMSEMLEHVLAQRRNLTI